MTTNQFIGSWALVSSVFKGEDGAIHYPLGEQMLVWQRLQAAKGEKA